MNKIYRVIQKLESDSLRKCPYDHYDLYRQSVFNRYHSGKHFPEFLPTRWRQKSTGIDMEQITLLSPCVFQSGRSQ